MDALAKIGCAAISPDNYHHAGPEADFSAKKASLRDSHILNDIGSALDYLAADARVDSGRLAVIGHCMGGRTAFMAASLFPILRGAVVYYSGGMFVSRGDEGPNAFERLHKILCPVIGFFGAEDKNPSATDVRRIDEELSLHAIVHEFHSYRGAGHAFCNVDDPEHYNAEAATDSWQRTVTFLKAQIGAR